MNIFIWIRNNNSNPVYKTGFLLYIVFQGS
nr:MAG TPA: hypothetical protein [Bacteriophage sp.]